MTQDMAPKIFHGKIFHGNLILFTETFTKLKLHEILFYGIYNTKFSRSMVIQCIMVMYGHLAHTGKNMVLILHNKKIFMHFNFIKV